MSKVIVPWYEKELDPKMGYVPSELLPDAVAEERLTRSAEEVVLWHYKRRGLDSVHNLMGLIENCSIPDWFSGPEYEHRILSYKLQEERLTTAARKHLGGGDDHEALAFNRVSAANITVVAALAERGTTAVYLTPRYPGKNYGYAHLSSAVGMELAGTRWSMITSGEAFSDLVAQESSVSILVICPHYRGLLPEDEMRKACAVAHERGIPVYIDDASGARTRPFDYGQASALDMGADIVVTSTDKVGLNGPRAGVVLGRKDFMLKVSAAARVLGTSARPSVTAAAIKALEDYDKAQFAKDHAEWEIRHKRIHRLVQPQVNTKVQVSATGGIIITMSDFMDLVLEQGGKDAKDVPGIAPVDACCAHAMSMLRHHGVMNGVPFFYRGASKFPYIRVNTLTTSITDEELAEAFISGISEVVQGLTSPTLLERLLFGKP